MHTLDQKKLHNIVVAQFCLQAAWRIAFDQQAGEYSNMDWYHSS